MSMVIDYLNNTFIPFFKNLDTDKIVGIAIFIFSEYLWSREQLLQIQTIYILKEYRTYKLFNQTMNIIKQQAKNRPIHMTISTKLMADKLMERYGFEQLGGLWRLPNV